MNNHLIINYKIDVRRGTLRSDKGFLSNDSVCNAISICKPNIMGSRSQLGPLGASQIQIGNNINNPILRQASGALHETSSLSNPSKSVILFSSLWYLSALQVLIPPQVSYLS